MGKHQNCYKDTEQTNNNADDNYNHHLKMKEDDD